jgi:hypothetical protein
MANGQGIAVNIYHSTLLAICTLNKKWAATIVTAHLKLYLSLNIIVQKTAPF